MLNVWFTDGNDKALPDGLLVEWFVTLAFCFHPDKEETDDMGRHEAGDTKEIVDEAGLDDFLKSYLQG
jgi:hypothetical protein